MTAIHDAMKKAGGGAQAAQATLATAAYDALKQHGTPAKALGTFATFIMQRRDARDALCLEYLKSRAADMAAKPAAGKEGHNRDVTQAPFASPAPAASPSVGSPPLAGKAAEAKPKPPKVAKVRPTAAQREAARRSIASASDALYDAYRVVDQVGGEIAIGNLSFGAMDELISTYATEAAKKLTIGKRQTVDAILLQKIEKKYPSTFATTVRERVPSIELRVLIDEADREARDLITRAMRNHRNMILNEGPQANV